MPLALTTTARLVFFTRSAGTGFVTPYLDAWTAFGDVEFELYDGLEFNKNERDEFLRKISLFDVWSIILRQ